MLQQQFGAIVFLIQQSRNNAIKAVNTELITLYWNIGAYINKQLLAAQWGEKTIDELAAFIQKQHPELRGFTRSGLYRMVQFHNAYSRSSFVAPVVRQIQNVENQDARGNILPKGKIKKEYNEIVSPLVQQLEVSDLQNSILVKLSWTNHLVIFSRCKTEEEKTFYIQVAIKEKYSKRELERQISAGLFERIMLGSTQLSASLKDVHPNIGSILKDNYILEFLNLTEQYNENDLQKGLIKQMRQFILELGKDFLFIGEEHKVQVGNSDFYIDLLFYHRGLQCLVAFELKTDKFKPEHLGQLNFYLEALDRDVKKSSENPSIGILLCKDKDSEVVEYALSRSLSPTMVAEYKTQLPDKKLLQQKLHELFKNTETDY